MFIATFDGRKDDIVRDQLVVLRVTVRTLKNELGPRSAYLKAMGLP